MKQKSCAPRISSHHFCISLNETKRLAPLEAVVDRTGPKRSEFSVFGANLSWSDSNATANVTDCSESVENHSPPLHREEPRHFGATRQFCRLRLVKGFGKWCRSYRYYPDELPGFSDFRSTDPPTNVDSCSLRRSMIFRIHAAFLAFTLTGMVGCDQGAPVVDAGSSETRDGQRWFSQSCATCHGMTGQGMPHQGANLRTSQNLAKATDDELFELIRDGRQPTDPKSIMKLPMPPRGGNPSMTDGQIRQIMAYLRQMQRDAGTAK